MNDPVGEAENIQENMPLPMDITDSGTFTVDIRKTGEDFIEFSGDEDASDRVYISVPNYQLSRPVEQKLRPNRKTRYQLSNHPLATASVSGPLVFRPKRAPTRQERNQHAKFLINVKDTFWSIKERSDLICALKTYGMFDIYNLCKEVPTKTEPQIMEFIKVAWKTTQKNLNEASNENSEDEPETPITQWLDALEASATLKGDRSAAYNLMLPKFFLFISKYGNHPDPENCGGINYRDAYEYIYHMLCGLPGKSMSPETSRFVRKTLHCLSVRARGSSNEQLSFISNIQGVPSATPPADNRESVDAPDSPRTDRSQTPKDKTERNTLQELLKLPGVNPLNVPIRILEFRNNMLIQD